MKKTNEKIDGKFEPGFDKKGNLKEISIVKEINKEMINKENYFQNTTHLNYHTLLDFAKCEYLYKCKTEGTVPDKKTQAMSFGSAVHNKISGVFEDNYVVGNKTSKLEKERIQFEIDAGKSHLRLSDMAGIESCLSEMERQPLFNKYSEGFKEQIVTGKINGINVKAMIDVLNDKKGYIVDWKTTRNLVGFDPRQYTGQLAFYRKVVFEKFGEKAKCLLGVVDKTNTNHFRMFEMDERILDHAENANTLLIDKLKQAKKSGIFEQADDFYTCFDCPNYQKCKFTEQKEITLIS